MVIYYYNRSQQGAVFFIFILVKKKFYMFRKKLLPIIRRLNTVFTANVICHTSYVDCLLARSGWNRVLFHPDLASSLPT